MAESAPVTKVARMEDGLVVFEPNHRGHRLDYCEALIRYAADLDVPAVLAMCSDGLVSGELKLRSELARLPLISVDLGPLPDITDRGKYSRWVCNELGKLRARFPEARICVLEGDKLLPYMARHPSKWDGRTSILVMRMPNGLRPLQRGERLKTIVKIVAGWVLTRAGARVVALVPATTRAPAYGPRLGFVGAPDPIVVNPGAEPWPLDPERTWFGVVGHITARKNLPLVVRALAQLKDAGRCGLLVAGRIDPSLRGQVDEAIATFRRTGGVVEIADRLLEQAELDRAIRDVDAVVIAHSSEGPSGIVGKALALGTWIVAAGAESLRDDIADRPGVGEWTSLRADTLASAFTRVLQRSTQATTRQEMAGPEDFAAAVTGWTA